MTSSRVLSALHWHAYDLTHRHEDALDAFSKALEIFEKQETSQDRQRLSMDLDVLCSAGRCEDRTCP